MMIRYMSNGAGRKEIIVSRTIEKNHILIRQCHKYDYNFQTPARTCYGSGTSGDWISIGKKGLETHL